MQIYNFYSKTENHSNNAFELLENFDNELMSSKIEFSFPLFLTSTGSIYFVPDKMSSIFTFAVFNVQVSYVSVAIA